MGLLGLFNKKKARKDFATLEEVKRPKEAVEVSDKPLKRSDIGEVDFEARPEEDSAGTGAPMSMFDVGQGSGEAPDPYAEVGSAMALEDAMEQARKYLIVHAQIPNGSLPKKSSKRENGTFYFEFQDRELHRIELDSKGEVIDWEREKL